MHAQLPMKSTQDEQIPNPFRVYRFSCICRQAAQWGSGMPGLFPMKSDQDAPLTPAFVASHALVVGPCIERPRA